jgi:AcrR family transcriptional regulator
MNEEDKRVIRTRSQLAEALINLSCEEGYEAVTIKSITDRAEINYRTFYRHYDGKDDLLHEVLRTTMAGLRQVMPPPTAIEISDSNFEEIARVKGRTLYEYVADNSVIFKVLLQSGPAALVPIQKLARAETERYFADMPTKKIPYELVANHMITSTFSFIQWWLNNDMSHTPQQMGDFAAQLIMLPIRNLLMGDNLE